MVVMPRDPAVTIPVPLPIAAMPVELLLQVPPPVKSLSVRLAPGQRLMPPKGLITPAEELTVRVA
jgi:hypothetical protein